MKENRTLQRDIRKKLTKEDLPFLTGNLLRQSFLRILIQVIGNINLESAEEYDYHEYMVSKIDIRTGFTFRYSYH